MYLNKSIEVRAEKNKVWMKKHPIITIIGFVLFVVILLLVFNRPSDSMQKHNKEIEQIPTGNKEKDISKENAQKELDNFIALAQKSKIVVSYEFSDKASNIYVNKIWYEQTVQFKKDFIAKIGTLKKLITGFTHFEVKDVYSNEKVGEIKPFSQSIEVYK